MVSARWELLTHMIAPLEHRQRRGPSLRRCSGFKTDGPSKSSEGYRWLKREPNSTIALNPARISDPFRPTFSSCKVPAVIVVVLRKQGEWRFQTVSACLASPATQFAEHSP